MKKIALILLCLSLIAAAAGCNSPQETEPNPEKETADAVLPMADFQALLQDNPSVEEVAGFIGNNIADVSKEDAAKMVEEFEKRQQDYLPELQNLFEQNDMQNKINSEYGAIAAQSEIKDSGLKNLMNLTRNSGYKVETAEGFYYPIIDYSFYKKFGPHVTPEIKDYIDIMAQESDKVPAKDAALVIGWDEVIKRAVLQEKFLEEYTDAAKTKDLAELFKKYLLFTFYGLNNTPLFSYDTKTMDPIAKEAYLAFAANAGNSEFLNALKGFLELLGDNDYQLNDKVIKSREKIVENLIDAVIPDENDQAVVIVYQNNQYGFSFSLPKSWEGYKIITDEWHGLAVGGQGGEDAAASGPLISIRHPQWTAEEPRQDIPIMVFTVAQWDSLQNEEFHIGAAPIGPSELGRNSKYVFALPARYNYAFPTGYEEVEKILEGKPLK